MHAILHRRLLSLAERLEAGWDPRGADELLGLLGEVLNRPNADLRLPLRKVVEVSASHAGNARWVARRALLALGQVGTTEDVPLLRKALLKSPYWDVRMFAAAALGNLSAPSAGEALTVASTQEPYYFVRRWIEAGRNRQTAHRSP
jgi:HEAT repeat protein